MKIQESIMAPDTDATSAANLQSYTKTLPDGTEALVMQRKYDPKKWVITHFTGLSNGNAGAVTYWVTMEDSKKVPSLNFLTRKS